MFMSGIDLRLPSSSICWVVQSSTDFGPTYSSTCISENWHIFILWMRCPRNIPWTFQVFPLRITVPSSSKNSVSCLRSRSILCAILMFVRHRLYRNTPSKCVSSYGTRIEALVRRGCHRKLAESWFGPTSYTSQECHSTDLRTIDHHGRVYLVQQISTSPSSRGSKGETFRRTSLLLHGEES